MNSTETYTKKLCMTELQVQRHCYQSSHFFDTGSGKVNASFGLIVHGEASFFSAGKRLALHPGDLFYLPEGIRYHSVWLGSPEIEFFRLDIISKKYDVEGLTSNFAMQHLSALSTPETMDTFRKIFDLFATGDRIDRVKAIGLYYLFYAQALQHLIPEPQTPYHSILLTATRYIEEHYTQDFEISELATVCCISESRLYHLFRNELQTTPIRYRSMIRVEQAVARLRSSDDSIEQIGTMVGFNSAAYFRETFKAHTGFTPAEFRSMVRSASGI